MALDDAVRFHGHLCPMFYLGLRMGKLALKTLGRGKEKGLKLLAVVEFNNCLADGIQFVTGATYGKNALYYKEHGKFAASFYDLVTDKSIRIVVKNDVLEKVLEYGLKGEEVKSLPPKDRKKEADALFMWAKRVVEELKGMKDEELFDVGAALLFEADPIPSLAHLHCLACGEIVLADFAVEKDGRTFCKECI